MIPDIAVWAVLAVIAVYIGKNLPEFANKVGLSKRSLAEGEKGNELVFQKQTVKAVKSK